MLLDSASCSRLTSPWLVSLMGNAVIPSPPVLLALLFPVLVGLVWVIRTLSPKRHSEIHSQSWKYQLTRVGSILLLVYLLVTLLPTLAAVRKGLVASIPSDSGTHVDAIVVLGRGKQLQASRVVVAAELWKAKRAPMIFVSGKGDAPPMISLLEQQDVPARVLEGENCSKSTEENALFTATLLQPQEVKKILLVTDPPHMLRSLLTFRSFGFTVIPHMSPLPPQFSPKKRNELFFGEYIGLVGYSLMGWFFPQHIP